MQLSLLGAPEAGSQRERADPGGRRPDPVGEGGRGGSCGRGGGSGGMVVAADVVVASWWQRRAVCEVTSFFYIFQIFFADCRF